MNAVSAALGAWKVKLAKVVKYKPNSASSNFCLSKI